VPVCMCDPPMPEGERGRAPVCIEITLAIVSPLRHPACVNGVPEAV